jgi:hypothetical protein
MLFAARKDRDRIHHQPPNRGHSASTNSDIIVALSIVFSPGSPS